MTKKINSKTLTLAILFGLALAVVLISGTFSKMIDSRESAQTENVSQIANSSSSIAGELALGTNLHGIADWSTQLPFLDAFKFSRQWITQCKRGEPGCSGSWSTNEYEKLDLDEYGWVKSLPAPEEPPEYTRVGTLMFRDVERYPGGQYLVTYEGEGTIEYQGDATKDEAASTPGRDVINVTPSKGGIYLLITATDPNKNGNYLRNIRVVQAKYEQTYESEIFNPDFLERIKKFQALRFMDWMGTNDSEQGEWENRPKLATASYRSKSGGAPVEIMVKLANRLQVDPWFTLPHMATDEYITKFAEIVKDSLDPNLTIYLEYSNEVWNAQFEQFHWVKDNGQISGGKTPYQSYGVRTAQMCDLWKGVFAEQSGRVKCVMATHTANPGVAKQVLNCDQWKEAPCYKHGIDALAITSYFNGRLGFPQYEQAIESWIDDPNIDEFESALQQLKDGSVLDPSLNKKKHFGSTNEFPKEFQEYSAIAKEKGLELVVYEGGSHVVGIKQVQNNEKLTNFFIELHRQPGFYDRYMEMLNAWQDEEGTRTLFMNFSDIGKPSKWGSWGVLEYVDQESSPRYDALIDFIDKTIKN